MSITWIIQPDDEHQLSEVLERMTKSGYRAYGVMREGKAAIQWRLLV